MIEKPLVLIVGLGNPGEKYAKTRHNVGFMVLDDIHHISSASAWSWSGNGLVAAGSMFGEPVMLLKPLTMMNSSGEAVVAVNSSFEVPFDNIIVVHDEMDINFSEVRTKLGGGHAGHKGVASVATSLATPDFHRIRVGVGRPAPGASVIDHVLGNFSKEESESIPGTIMAAVTLVEEIIVKLASEQEAKK